MSPERFVRIALTATYRNPKLLSCSQESFFNCLMQLGAMGLEPDGRRAHLIPFGNECTLIVDYKGIAELLRRNGDVAAIHCDVVGSNDTFEIRFGTRGILDHVPNLRDRGTPICAYSWVKLPDGNEEFDVMGFDEIESIRRRSKTPEAGPWKTDWNEMAKKTVFRRHSKTLPLSPETREALDRDTDGDALTEAERFAAATPVKVASVAELPKRRGRPPKGPQEDLGGALGVPTMPPEPPQTSAGIADTQEPDPGPESISDATLDQQVRDLVTEAGFTEAEMLAVMKPLRMAEAEFTSLSQCSAHHLALVLKGWENAVVRLRENRAKSQQS